MDYEERAAVYKRRINTSVSLPLTLVEVIDRIAESEDGIPTRIIERILRKGLAVERAERESKLAAK